MGPTGPQDNFIPEPVQGPNDPMPQTGPQGAGPPPTPESVQKAEPAAPPPLEKRIQAIVEQDQDLVNAIYARAQEQTVQYLMSQGLLPEDPSQARQPPAAPEPNPEDVRQRFNDWFDYQMSKGGKADIKNALYEMMQTSVGLSTTTARQEAERLLEEKMGPLAEKLHELDVVAAEKQFFEKHELPDPAKEALRKRMLDPRPLGPTDMVKFAQLYKDAEIETARQRAEAQAARRSNTLGTGFMETPGRRDGVDPQVDGIPRKDLAKQILATVGDDKKAAERKQLLQRWNS